MCKVLFYLKQNITKSVTSSLYYKHVMIVSDDLGELSRVINYAPRVVNCAPGGHLLYCCHLRLSQPSLMIITYVHHLWSLLTIITYDHHLWSSLMIITYDHHLWSSLIIITYDHHLRSSLTINTYDILYDHNMFSVQATV